jgi:hypothetical protein
LVNISASLLVSASSLRDSASALATSASTAFNINNSQTTILNNIVGYTSSLQSAISVSGSDLTVLGNLTINGDTTTLNTANLIIEDKLIVIASGSTNSTDANGGGIYISGADASVTWNSVQSRLDINKPLNVAGNITLSGTVDGVDVSTLGTSFTALSSSYLLESASVSASIKTLNAYTASNNSNITAIHTATASFNTFTSSTYTTFSSSVDSRLDSVEGSIGGAGIGSTVNDLIVSASASILVNTQQQITLNVLANGSPSASVNSVIRLAATASNLAGAAVGTTNQLNALNTSASVIFISASSLTTSASLALNTNNQQSAKLSLLENFTGSTFINYSQSVSQSIAQISASIGGANVNGLLNGLTASVSALTITQSGISASYENFSSSYLLVSSSFRTRIDGLNQQSSSYLDFVSGSRSGSNPSFPPFSASVEQRFNTLLSEINQVSNSAWLDSDQNNYSTSIALFISSSDARENILSASVWNAASGLSRSINVKIQDVSGSITSRIDTIVIGTGFVTRPTFDSFATSSNLTTASLNSFSASVKASGSIINTFTQSVNLITASLSAYTSSIQTILVPTNSIDVLVKNDLYVSGTITSNRMIVNTTINSITTSIAAGDNVFGDVYGDSQTLNGITTINGALRLNQSGSNPSFVSISADIRVVSGTVIAPIFVGTFEGAYSSSIQTNISGTNGFSAFLTSITSSVNDTTQSLSSSISSSIGLLSASVASINASQVSTASLNTITSSLYDTTQSLNNSVISLYAFSASVTNSLQALNIYTSSIDVFAGTVVATGSIMNTFTSSVNTFSASVIATGSIINTFTSSINTYTSSLKGAVSVTGSNLRVLGNANIQNDLIVSGNIIAQQYIVSSSVTYMTTSFSNGSTIFGNDVTDNHNFTGSVYVVGSISSSATITAATHSGFILANNAVVSSSLQFVEYGALLTSSVSGTQAVSGTLIVSGTTSLTGSVGVDLRSGSEFYIRNGVTRIDSVLFVTDNDYVNSAYVGGNVSVNNYLASGFTAHYDGGVQITGSLIVGAQNGSGSQFSGSVSITGSTRITENLQVQGNSSVSGNFIGTTISASSAVTASSLRVEGLTRINGEIDIDTTQITIGAGGNAVVDETRLNTLNLRVDSDTFFNSNITAISGSTRVKSLAINDLSMSRIPYVDSTDTLVDSANFTYNGVTFKVGGGAFEIDDATGNIRTSGSLKVDGITTLHSTLNVSGAVGITGSLIVTGSTIISSSLRVNNTASFAHLNVTGSTNVTGSLSVGGALAISGSTRVSGNFAVSGTLDISGSATFDSYVNITGGLAVTGGFSVKGEPVLIGDSMTDSIIISGGLEITGSLTRNTTNLKATGSNNPADAIYRLTEAQAWSSSFTTDNTSSGAWIRTPDEYLEYFVGQGSNKRRYITPVWLDETLYADDYFDISVVSGADSDYVF